MPRAGTGRIYQRGSVFWIDYSYRGQRHRESAGTRKKDATDLLKKRLGEMGSGRFVGPDAEKVTFDDLATGLVNDYKKNRRSTLDRTELSITHLRDYFQGDCRALDITTPRIDAYITHRQDEGAANATIKRELMALSKMFSLALMKNGGSLRDKPTIPTLEVNNIRKGFLEGGTLEAVIAELPEPLRPVVRFATFTGWRKAEILALTWAQVDFEAGTIRLDPGTTKNKDGRSFPFGELPPLVKLMETRREHTRTVERETGQIVSWVFHRDGQRIKSMRTAWDGACRRAGVPDGLFHDLRRTAVRHLVRAGVTERVAMELVGHKTRSIFDRYNITNEADRRAGVAKLAKLHAGPVAETNPVIPMRAAR
jgi:integrase